MTRMYRKSSLTLNNSSSSQIPLSTKKKDTKFKVQKLKIKILSPVQWTHAGLIRISSGKYNQLSRIVFTLLLRVNFINRQPCTPILAVDKGVKFKNRRDCCAARKSYGGYNSAQRSHYGSLSREFERPINFLPRVYRTDAIKFKFRP